MSGPRIIDISLRLWGLVAAFERLTEHCEREAEKHPPGSLLDEMGYGYRGEARAYAMARESLERELTAAGVPREEEQVEEQAEYGAEEDKQDFAVEVLSRGACIDSQAGDGRVYQIETYTLRLNHVALNECLLARMMNDRKCYPSGPEGNQLWEDRQWTMNVRQNLWRAKMLEALGIDPHAGSCVITQIQAEFFAAVWMRVVEL